MHKDRRESVGILTLIFASYLVMWLKGRENHVLLLIGSVILFLWIFFPFTLRPLAFLFRKAVFILTFLSTALIVAFVYYILFILFKPLLYLFDKRFYRERERGLTSYYVKSDNDWQKNIKDLF
ncbi:MAG: hypothetical protein AB7T10_00250 [bacterium]